MQLSTSLPETPWSAPRSLPPRVSGSREDVPRRLWRNIQHLRHHAGGETAFPHNLDEFRQRG